MVKIAEFEDYLYALAANLNVAGKLKDEICCELQQALYGKYNELLIKGYPIEDSVTETLVRFENPAHLAYMFNMVHRRDNNIWRIGRMIHLKKAALIAAVIRILMLI